MQRELQCVTCPVSETRGQHYDWACLSPIRTAGHHRGGLPWDDVMWRLDGRVDPGAPRVAVRLVYRQGQGRLHAAPSGPDRSSRHRISLAE